MLYRLSVHAILYCMFGVNWGQFLWFKLIISYLTNNQTNVNAI